MSSGGSSAPAAEPTGTDLELFRLARDAHGLTGDPAEPRGASRIHPDDDPFVKLGQLLFFSQSLAGSYDVSCATCHHPAFGGSDALSLSVGVSPVDPTVVGPGRRVDPDRDLDPLADGGPNMHRNSLTTFNAVLFDRALMHDGRIEVLSDSVAAGGRGQRIRTMESGPVGDLDDLSGLLEFTAKGPIVNDNEMRGFLYTHLPAPAEYREHLVRRLRGEVDSQYSLKADAAANWLRRFREALDQPDAGPGEIITMLNMQRAMAAYMASQVFVDTPWRSYLAGDVGAISEEAKLGALLFLTPADEGGLGCAQCHAGDRFTDEAFYNVGFPQIGRGFGRADGQDMGRWIASRADADRHAFRTPSLLNVAETPPYGHAGTFETLAEVVRYHADPRKGVRNYDFGLEHLSQFAGTDVRYASAEQHTSALLSLPNFADVERMLPRRALDSLEVTRIVAFLGTLTDPCVADYECISQWAPAPDEDPDGHTLVRDAVHPGRMYVTASSPSDYPERVALAPATAEPLETFSDVLGCEDRRVDARNSGRAIFLRRSDPSFGLTDAHSYHQDTWFRIRAVEATMIGGGVTAAYVTEDCWPDLVFTGGEATGMGIYRNVAGTRFERVEALPADTEREFSGSAVVDLDGDYRRELLLGNVAPGELPIYQQTDDGRYVKRAGLRMLRPTYGMSFAPLDESGYPYLYLAHWTQPGRGVEGTAPALWRNDGTALEAWDARARTSAAFIDQRYNFTPAFADFTGDGRTDLVVASDFQTSVALRNVADVRGGSRFVNETDRDVLTDENGMGSALLDVDNDGVLEWFVTSVLDPTGEAAGVWGVSGNRMYRSVSTPERIAFEDITDRVGVRDGAWGWGACAADFDNDGFIDLFHVNGWGYIPDEVVEPNPATMSYQLREAYDAITREHFQRQPSRLFMNDGEGRFDERAADWSIDTPSEGRGLACFDYDRDGDTDVALFDHSRGMQFYENQIGSGPGRAFLDVRLVGRSPNTDAIGARVYVTADVGRGRGTQTQLRLGQANSNFNSQNLPNLRFGLGEARVVQQLRVVWPGGAVLECRDLPPNRFVVIDERRGAAACPT